MLTTLSLSVAGHFYLTYKDPIGIKIRFPISRILHSSDDFNFTETPDPLYVKGTLDQTFFSMFSTSILYYRGMLPKCSLPPLTFL